MSTPLFPTVDPETFLFPQPTMDALALALPGGDGVTEAEVDEKIEALPEVARSGSYEDLAHKPAIPSSPADVGADPAGSAAAVAVTVAGKLNAAEKGANGGVAPLDSSGLPARPARVGSLDVGSGLHATDCGAGAHAGRAIGTHNKAAEPSRAPSLVHHGRP
jgi:hypothetical protein